MAMPVSELGTLNLLNPAADKIAENNSESSDEFNHLSPQIEEPALEA